MTIVRVSLEQVRVHNSIYRFISSDEADQFQTCLVYDDLDKCEIKTPPLAIQPVHVDPDDFGPGA
jgi:hypothetical protein